MTIRFGLYSLNICKWRIQFAIWTRACDEFERYANADPRLIFQRKWWEIGKRI